MLDHSAEEILEIIDLSRKMKTARESGEYADALKGKTLIMLFEKPSTRTRLSFEAAMTQLGGHAIYLDRRSSQFTLARTEDELRATMRFGDALMYRALKAADVELAASFGRLPVIDGCSEKYHPAQALGDLLTMVEHAGGLEKVKKVAWLGIENNVSNSLKLVCTRLGIRFALASPEANAPSIDSELNRVCDATGLVERFSSAQDAVKGADFVHTDTWLDMEYFGPDGRPKPQYADEFARRVALFTPFQLNAALIDSYAPQAKIMHCMPCHAGYEITADAIDHPNSVIFDQAENRLHIEKAILLRLVS